MPRTIGSGHRSSVGVLSDLRPVPGAPRTAARAATCVLVGLGTLAGTGHLDLSLYATFGVFASVYATTDPSAVRVRRQAAMGALLAAAVLSGALVATSGEQQWWIIPVAAAWAGLAARLSDRFRWRPPGPLFLVFAVAACGSIPVTLGSALAAGLVTAATAALAVAVGIADDRLRPRAPESGATPGSPPAGPPPAAPRGARQRIQVVRCTLAVLVAGVTVTALGLGHPYWAMVSAVVPMAKATLDDQLRHGAHRAVGTFLGLGLAAVLLAADLPLPVAIGTAAALQAMVELTVARHYGVAMLFVTPLALLMGDLARPQPLGTLLSDRLLETVVGVTIGVVAVYLSRPPRPTSAVPDQP